MKKIMFSTEYGLEQAVLEGRKTQTRRVARLPDKSLTRGDLWHTEMGIDDKGRVHFTFCCIDGKQRDLFPQYQPGETIAIAQSYKTIYDTMEERDGNSKANEWWVKAYDYVGDGLGPAVTPGWTNKMFVVGSLMPHRIRITNIGIEPLQDISDEDCRKEGIMEGEFMNTWDRFYYDHWGDVANHITFRTPRKAFASLIDKTSGRCTWQKNPWVWVYHFEKLDL